MMCKHRPMSNGWSAGGSLPPVTWCGYCKAEIPVDYQWAEAYYDKKVAKYGPSDEFERDRKRLLSHIDAALDA